MNQRKAPSIDICSRCRGIRGGGRAGTHSDSDLEELEEWEESHDACGNCGEQLTHRAGLAERCKDLMDESECAFKHLLKLAKGIELAWKPAEQHAMAESVTALNSFFSEVEKAVLLEATTEEKWARIEELFD